MPLQQLTNYLERAREEAEAQDFTIRDLRTALDVARTRIDELAAEVRNEKARANGLEIERNLLLKQKQDGLREHVGKTAEVVRSWPPHMQREMGVPVSRLRPTEHWMHRAK